MSFVEKNKAWLLPLLGVGTAAVIWMNIRTFTSPPAPVAPVPSEPSATPAAAAQEPNSVPTTPPPAENPAATIPTPATNTGAPGADLWDDLKVLSAPPPALVNEATFQDQGRRSTMAVLHPIPAPKGLPIPTGVREPQPAPEPKGASAPAESPDTPPPSLDFLIHGPSGPRAWFEGRSYRPGDPIGPPHRSVGAIGSSTVELKSPKGKTVLTTNPFHPSGPAPRPVVEAP